jgi:hypothetical protein
MVDDGPQRRDVDRRQPLKLLFQVDKVVGDVRLAVLCEAQSLGKRPAEDGLG